MKFNFSLKGRQAEDRYTPAKIWVPDQQWELYSAILSASLHGSFHDLPAEQLDRLRELIRETDAHFVARLAIYLREQQGRPALSFLLMAELSAICKDSKLISLLALRIIRGPEEIAEWLDHYSRSNARKGGKLIVPAHLRKSLSIIFNSLDEYRFARYRQDEQSNLRYALSVIRPKPSDKARQVLFRKIMQDSIPPRSTWYSEWTALNLKLYDSPELKQSVLRDKWKEGISSFRMGYICLLENLPALLAAGVSGKVLKLAVAYLGNAAAAKGSGVSPLRITEVYRELKDMQEGGVPMLLEALEKAIRHSIDHFAGEMDHGRTVIAMDISPSMKYPLSEDSTFLRYDLGPLLALLLGSRGEQVKAGIIGNTWRPAGLSAHRILPLLEQMQQREGEAGYAINGHLVIQDLLRKRQLVDKVMIFTDCQLWDHRPFNQSAGADLGRMWRLYRQLAPKARLYLFDLSGYNKAPLECLSDDVYLVSGWNERIFSVLKSLENGAVRIEAINHTVI